MTPSRTSATLLALTTLAAGLLVPPSLAPAPATAEEPGVLTVVGPPDLLDSGLWQDVLVDLYPDYPPSPRVTLRYVALDAEDAVDYAESGRASVLLLADPEAESRFVADGFSDDPAGRLIFWSDDVLVGPDADPAGVRAAEPRDLVTALERVADAGAAGRADFLSLGGTSDRTIDEHALWARTDGVATCTLAEGDGGGAVPSTVGGPCPATIPYPSWYHPTGDDQPTTVLAAETCDVGTSGACYVLTDRGSFDALDRTRDQFGSPASQVPSLGVLVSGKEAGSGSTPLVHAFHAYVVDPKAVPAGTTVAHDAAQSFVWSVVDAYGPSTYRLDGRSPAYRPAATPVLSLVASTPVIRVGEVDERGGVLRSRVPGAPPLRDVELTLNDAVCNRDECDYVDYYPVATTRTDADGAFRFRTRPSGRRTWVITYDDVRRTVDPATALEEEIRSQDTSAGSVSVLSWWEAPTVRTGSQGRFRVGARLRPAGVEDSKVRLYVARPGRPLAYRTVVRVPEGSQYLSRVFRLPRGTWRIELRYVHSRGLDTGTYARTVVLR